MARNNIPGPEGESITSTTPSACGDVATLARLSIHIRENNIAYLIGVAVCYQIGIIDKIMNYGSGICGI